MARFPTKVVRVLAFEETTRVANFFTLLVEIDVRLPKTTKTKKRKAKASKSKHKPIKQCCYMKCINNKNFPPCSLSKTARRDLYLHQFIYAIS
jgi:hypothetical protein